MCDFNQAYVYAEIIARAVQTEDITLLKETVNNFKMYLDQYEIYDNKLDKR